MTKLSVVPIFMRVTIRSLSGDFFHCAKQLFSALPKCGFPPIMKWEDAKTEGENIVDMEAALERKKAGSEGESPVFVLFQFASGYLGGIRLRRDSAGHAFCSINIDKTVRGATPYADLIKFQKLAVALCGMQLVDPGVKSASLLAEGGGATAIPDVPLVDGNSHICVTNADEVNASYNDPDAFWSAGWDIACENGSQRLLTRDLDVVCGPEYLERILPHQWAMARTARPGETSYSKPVLHPSEEAVYSAGEAKLTGVGYHEEDQLVEFSCVLNRGEHIHGWEIFALFNIVESGQLSDGSSVSTVRIVFEERWAAEQEKRPLLDIGCRVYYYADDGELREITE